MSLLLNAAPTALSARVAEVQQLLLPEVMKPLQRIFGFCHWYFHILFVERNADKR